MVFLAILFALITFASADFDLYHVRILDRPQKIYDAFMVFNENDNPQCVNINIKLRWDLLPDVSGNKLGVRCKGPCAYNDVSDGPKTGIISSIP